MGLYIINKKVKEEAGEFNPNLDLKSLRLSPHTMPSVFNKGWELSEAYIETLYDKLFLGKVERLNTEAIKNGILKEQETIDLVNKILGKNYLKNETQFDNGTFKGTPDSWEETQQGIVVVDFKTVYPNPDKENPVEVFDKLTEAKVKSSYLAQLFAYYILMEDQWWVPRMAPIVKIIYSDLLNGRIKEFTFPVQGLSLYRGQVKRLYKILLSKYNYGRGK